VAPSKVARFATDIVGVVKEEIRVPTFVVVPPGGVWRHWYESVPLPVAVTLKVAVEPVATPWATGADVMVGIRLTATTATALLTVAVTVPLSEALTAQV